MRLVRYGAAGQERPGLIDKDGQIRSITAFTQDIDGAFLATGLQRLANVDPETLPLVAGKHRFGSPVAGIRNFLACGLNYRDHAAEAKLDLPPEPLLFSKAASCIAGPDDDIPVPPGSIKLDWEVELGVVIGREAYRISEADALDYVAGYCLANDVSERDHQFNRVGQWLKGKSHPGFGPLGPWLVTPESLPNVENLALKLEVNGRTVQDGNTRDMVFKPAFLIHHISHFMRLDPGDVIITGTPAGVGMGFDPPLWLKAGDVMTVNGDGLGRQCQTLIAV
jgi:2,4-didehydro-3-deoxy-L-rhamnonate hydrolase